MITKDMFVTSNVDVVEIGFAALSDLSDEDYRSYVRDTLISVNHHDILVFDPTGSGLAKCREQLDILVSELLALRSQLPSRARV